MIISRAMPVFSRTLGLSGECDVVEFRKNAEQGISLRGKGGYYTVYPVEYKRGAPKESLCDILQLTAQAMCLEEMLVTEIPKGYLFYGKTRHREEVCFTEELRDEVRQITEEMHRLFARGYTPKTKHSVRCKACSLADLCLPKLQKNKNVSDYIAEMTGEV